MAVTHTTTTRTALATAIRTACNAGSAPVLVIGTSSLALPSTGVLASITLADFAAASSGSTTSPSDGNSAVATGTGTAAIAIVTDGTTEVFRGAVGVGSGEVQISSTSIASGDTVSLTDDVVWTAPS